MGADEIGRGNQIITSKIGRGNKQKKFASIVVAEEIANGSEIIVSKTDQGNKQKKIRLG